MRRTVNRSRSLRAMNRNFRDGPRSRKDCEAPRATMLLGASRVSESKQSGAAPSDLILGIESSCDETAAAIVAGGKTILSSVVASQIDIHRKYGGVVPELASREHLRRIVPVVREAASQAGIELRDVGAIAVTRGPGLVGSLIVGVTYGKALAMSLGKPLIPVNHLEGHVHAVLLEAHAVGRAPEFPAVCLIVSGGHTILYRVIQSAPGNHGNGSIVRSDGTPLHYGRIGGTRDDAAGEAYDKVAKMLALGYPGGPIIDQLAASGDPAALRFAAKASGVAGRNRRADRCAGPRRAQRRGDSAAVLEIHARSGGQLSALCRRRSRAANDGRRGRI